MDLTNLNQNKKNRRKPSVDLSTMVYGKVPPQAKELEDAVLGAIMLEKDVFDIVDDILVPEAFYVDAHQRVYRAFQSLSARKEPIDILTVVQELKRTEELDMVGGPYYITKLTNAVVSTANVSAHAHIVLQKYFAREVLRVSGEAISDAYEDGTDVFDLLDGLEAKVGGITAKHLRGTNKDTPKLAKEAKERIKHLKENKGVITGVTTGYRPLDVVTNGWQPTDLIILAARPSVGKTAFALNLARNAIIEYLREWIRNDGQGKPKGVGFFSLEMSAGQLMNRLIACEGEIDMKKISNGKFTSEAEYTYFNQVADKVGQYPLFIDDTGALTITEFRSRSRRLVNKHNVGLIIVDYLQLMSGKSDDARNREAEISNISRNLKAMAKELNVPIIALSQMHRAIEKDKRDPQLSDLRESGAIEQDADLVAFLTRPDYQKKDGAALDPSMRDDIKIWIRKHRNGELENILLKAVLSIQRCFDLDDYDTYIRMRQDGTPVAFPSAARGYALDDNTDDLPF